MKNYLLNKRGEEEYITSVEKNDDKTLTITFADGRVFTNILACEENLQKIASVQEKQASKGIENSAKLVRRKKMQELKVAATGICIAGAGIGLASACHVSPQDALGVTFAVGTVMIMGMIPSSCNLVRENAKIRELKKLEYRAEHMDSLMNFRDYPNALAGLKPEVARWFIEEKDPFSILNIDSYSREDLVQIVKNITVEKDLGLVYKKTKKASK